MRKVIERLVIVVFFVILLIGNVLMIYNLVNKYTHISSIIDLDSLITDKSTITIEYVNSGKNNEILNNMELKNILSNVKIREKKFKPIKNDIEYILSIKNEDNIETIKIKNRILYINSKIYIMDISISDKLNSMILKKI